MTSSGVFSFATQNLGDEMQSFAVLAHLRRVDHFLDRDRMADWIDGDTTCVFNSWFLNGNDFRPPADMIHPVWHGFAAGRPELLKGDWLEYLKRQGPIGCRDLHSVRLMESVGVPAHWTGCLSLFLGAAMSIPPRRRDGIYFVDVPAEAEPFIPFEITRRAVRMSTFPPASVVSNPLDRFAMVGRLIERIAYAELVVTRRLHVALPTASFGTPVVAIPDANISWADRRFSGYEDCFPTVFLADAAAKLTKIDWGNVPRARIPDELLRAHRDFCAELERRDLGTGAEPMPRSLLDDSARTNLRIRNVNGIRRPGGVRLRLGGCCFELPVLVWCDRYVDVVLGGFVGLAKLALVVEAREWGEEKWASWGELRNLALTAAEGLSEHTDGSTGRC